MDKNKKPFIPFVPTSAIVENGTGRTLEEILANLAVPIVNLNNLENETVATMMTKMYNYKDTGFAIIYTDTSGNSKLYSYVKQTIVDTLNKIWTFVSPAEPLQFTLNITGYYNADTNAFTVSNTELINTHGVFNNVYHINQTIDRKRPITISGAANMKPWTAFIQWAFDNKINYPILYLTGGDGVTEPWCLNSDIDNFDSAWTRSLTFYNSDVGSTHKQVLNLNISWSNGRPSVNSVYLYRSTPYKYLNENTALSKTNTSSYTPTKDYHPATKKYVDDQIGDINTILATVTTPEVSK